VRGFSTNLRGKKGERKECKECKSGEEGRKKKKKNREPQGVQNSGKRESAKPLKKGSLKGGRGSGLEN